MAHASDMNLSSSDMFLIIIFYDIVSLFLQNKISDVIDYGHYRFISFPR